jgi:hypothetical protein
MMGNVTGIDPDDIQIGSDDPPGAVVALVGNVQGLAHSV